MATEVGASWKRLNMVNREGQTREGKDGAAFGSFVLWVSVILVIYVVSIGPAAWMHQKTANQRFKNANILPSQRERVARLGATPCPRT